MLDNDFSGLVNVKMKPKIIFWLGGELTHYCLAHYMQQKYDAKYYAVIDITNKPKKFFLKQNLVKFEKIWYFFDSVGKPKKIIDFDFLENFEKKYKINLWKLAINERIFYRFFNFYKFTKNDILSLLEQECKLFEKIFENEKPDFFITKWPSRHHHQLFYEICRSLNIKVLILGQPKIGYKGMISENGETMDNVDEFNEIESTGRSFEELQEYSKSLMVNKQIDILHKNEENKSLSKIIDAGLEFLTSDNKHVKNNYYYFGRTKIRVIFSFFKSWILKNRRKSFIDKNLPKKFNDSIPSVYFPLGVDMERTLLISAPFFTNQIEVIRHIVKSLPINYQLILKENPAQISRDWRSISEYKEILNIPNVVLLHPSVKPEKLYEKCSLTISIAGSSAFEGLFYGKPSIVWSDVPYTLLSSVYRIREVENLPDLIKTALKKKVDVAELDRYMQFLEKNTFTFDRMMLSTKLNKLFYRGGILIDVTIPIKKMELFLKENKEILENLAEKHIEKINWHIKRK
mgnify:CR=1 FL=1